MSLTSLRVFLCRNDVKILIICTAAGGILQVLAKRYLKNHPEFLEDYKNDQFSNAMQNGFLNFQKALNEE